MISIKVSCKISLGPKFAALVGEVRCDWAKINNPVFQETFVGEAVRGGGWPCLWFT